jgi:hypothetical protein
MATPWSRIERLELEMQFRRWLWHARLLESLTIEQPFQFLECHSTRLHSVFSASLRNPDTKATSDSRTISAKSGCTSHSHSGRSKPQLDPRAFEVFRVVPWQ